MPGVAQIFFKIIRKDVLENTTKRLGKPAQTQRKMFPRYGFDLKKKKKKDTTGIYKARYNLHNKKKLSTENGKKLKYSFWGPGR